jgi:hypothetical protein
MIRWPRKRETRPLEPKIMVNPRLLELQTAKQILEEIFHARPSDVMEMILMRRRASMVHSYKALIRLLRLFSRSSDHDYP